MNLPPKVCWHLHRSWRLWTKGLVHPEVGSALNLFPHPPVTEFRKIQLPTDPAFFRNVVDGMGVEFMYNMYSPTVNRIEVIASL